MLNILKIVAAPFAWVIADFESSRQITEEHLKIFHPGLRNLVGLIMTFCSAVCWTYFGDLRYQKEHALSEFSLRILGWEGILLGLVLPLFFMFIALYYIMPRTAKK